MKCMVSSAIDVLPSISRVVTTGSMFGGVSDSPDQELKRSLLIPGTEVFVG